MIREVLKLDKVMNELAQELYQQKSLLVMGRGYNFATCLEGALVSGWGRERMGGALHIEWGRERRSMLHCMGTTAC